MKTHVLARWQVLALTAVACGKAPEGAAPERAMVDSCRVQLAPRQAALEPALPAAAAQTPKHASRLVAHFDLKLSAIQSELERNVPTRLAEEKKRPIGIAGHLDYTVDRGPLSLAVEGDTLLVRTDVRGHAQACKGSSCYASCDPQGQATARVPLRLTPDYRFAPSRVSFSFTRGCTVRALGVVKVDVTDSLQGAITPALRRVERDIDAKLPPMRTQAERLWSELGKSRSLPLGGCFIANPRGLVEGPLAAPEPGTLRARFGVVAYPEVRSHCGDAPSARDLPSSIGGLPPIPPLLQDPALPEQDDLVLTMVSPLSVAARGLESTDSFDAGGARTRIIRAAMVASGADAQLDLGLKGEACGDVGVRSPLGWTDDGRALRLAAPAFAKGERDRAAQGMLAPDVFVRELAGVRFSPPVAPDSLKELAPTIASGMSDPTVAVAVQVESVKPLEVALRGEDLAASVLVRGRVDIKQR